MNWSQLMASPFGMVHRVLHNVWAHDFAERLLLRRKAIAKADGIDGPGSSVEHFPTSIGDTTVTNTGGGFIRGALLGAALLAGGAGAMKYLAPDVPAVEQPADTTKPPPRKFTVEFLDKKGQPIKVEEK